MVFTSRLFEPEAIPETKDAREATYREGNKKLEGSESLVLRIILRESQLSYM